MKKKYIVSIIAIVLVFTLYFMINEPQADKGLTVKPTKGKFTVLVNATGELRSQSSIVIKAPFEVRSLNIYELKIEKIVKEGTVVKKGEYIASLDKTAITQKLKDAQSQEDKIFSLFKQKCLDTNITLSQVRDGLDNTEFTLQEKKLLVEQSIYEPPAIKRQAEINYEREQRKLKQEKKNYKIRVQKAITDLSIIEADLQKQRNNISNIMNVYDKFTITAPTDGIVIYIRDWNGGKRKAGSSFQVWNPSVAKLPDLTKMESVTFVNEIDVQKVKVGQDVIIKLDAVEGKLISGKIISVANIGEQRRGSDAKVFETIIKVLEQDTTLLPAMTTSNEIMIDSFNDVLFIPLESVHTFSEDSLKYNYVFIKKGSKSIKKEVLLGKYNDNEVIIEKGLIGDEEIFLSTPENEEESEVIRLKEKTK